MADLLQSWYDKNAVGSDYLPRLFVQGKTLQNDAARIQMQQQQLQNQYAQFQAESARANQQAEFQDKKFLYAMNQDKMDRTRQGMLDARSGQMQQAQVNNWTADNNRASAAADQNKKFQDAQMANWTKKNKEDAPADFSWVDGSTPQAATDAPPDAPQSSNPIQPYAGSGGSDAGDDLPEISGQLSPDASMLPTGNEGPTGVPGDEGPMTLKGRNVYGAPPAEPAPASATAPTKSSDDLSSHPGRAKWESVQRAAAITPGLISGMKSADRMAALQALGKVNILKQDPEVIDYQRRLDARSGSTGNAYKQDQIDQNQETTFQNDAREASRQQKAVDHYAGADLPFGTETMQSASGKLLQKGIPAADWKTVLADEIATQKNPAYKQTDSAVADAADWKKNHDTSIAGRANKAVAAADVNSANESKQWTALKENWAKENPFAMKVITDAAIAGKTGGQAPTQDEILAQIDKAAAQNGMLDKWHGETSWTGKDSNAYHPDPSKRGNSFHGNLSDGEDSASAKSANGDPLKNRDMALMVYDQIKNASSDTGLPKPATPEDALKLPSGTRYIGPDGKIRTRQ